MLGILCRIIRRAETGSSTIDVFRWPRWRRGQRKDVSTTKNVGGIIAADTETDRNRKDAQSLLANTFMAALTFSLMPLVATSMMSW